MKSYFTKIFSRDSTKTCQKRRMSNPNFHWRLIVSIFLPFNIIACFIAVYYFSLINKAEFVVNYPQSNQKTTSVNVKELGDLVKFFEQRKNKLDNWIPEQTSVVDPSL